MVATNKPKIIIVSGPTGVGKSRFAVELCEHLNGEILNLDSVQVYRELDIGAAKPPAELRARVAHHLFDCASISEHFDVGSYRRLAIEKIAEVIERGKLPILCGGSTMYLTVLIHGLIKASTSNNSPTDSQNSSKIFPRRAETSTEELYAELQQRDPKRALQIHANDRQRIARGVALLDQGIMPSEATSQHRFAEFDFNAAIFVMDLPRENIYRAIDERAAKMVAGGIIEEARGLVARYGKVRALDSLGYRQVLAWDGEDRLKLTADIATATRQYAKRQLTFWRNEPGKRGWLDLGLSEGLNADAVAALAITWLEAGENGQIVRRIRLL